MIVPSSFIDGANLARILAPVACEYRIPRPAVELADLRGDQLVLGAFRRGEGGSDGDETRAKIVRDRPRHRERAVLVGTRFFDVDARRIERLGRRRERAGRADRIEELVRRHPHPARLFTGLQRLDAVAAVTAGDGADVGEPGVRSGGRHGERHRGHRTLFVLSSQRGLKLGDRRRPRQLEREHEGWGRVAGQLGADTGRRVGGAAVVHTIERGRRVASHDRPVRVGQEIRVRRRRRHHDRRRRAFGRGRSFARRLARCRPLSVGPVCAGGTPAGDGLAVSLPPPRPPQPDSARNSATSSGSQRCTTVSVSDRAVVGRNTYDGPRTPFELGLVQEIICVTVASAGRR